jgi:hypothetical protein
MGLKYFIKRIVKTLIIINIQQYYSKSQFMIWDFITFINKGDVISKH